MVLAALLLLAGCFAGDARPPLTPVPVDLDLSAGLTEGTAPHPLSIAALRQRAYDGGEFEIDQQLEPGINYSRAIASYRSDGLKIYALLTVPLTPRPPGGYPVVIFNHGYIPPDQYVTTERYVAYVDAFARSGYIVIKSDYRGHGRSEGMPESAYGSSAYTIDVLNAAAAARRLPDADPNRIAMWGHSMGGYITLRAMVVDPDIKAGVIWAGVVDSYADMFTRWFSRGGSRRSWLSDTVEMYGDPQVNPAFWASLSANSYLSEISGPLQLHHGTGDAVVPYVMSVTLDEQMRAAGRTVELFLYPGDDHNISANRDGALALSVVFFDRYVVGDE